MKTYEQVKKRQEQSEADIRKIIIQLSENCAALSRWREHGAWKTLSVSLKRVEELYHQLEVESNSYRELCWILGDDEAMRIPLSYSDIAHAEVVIVDKMLIKSRSPLAVVHQLDLNQFISRTDYIIIDQDHEITIIYGEPITLKELLEQTGG